MEMFFEEFEDYIFDRYGEKSYLKNIFEDTFLPLKESLEEITKEEIIESLFGKSARESNIKSALEKVRNTLESIVALPNTRIENVGISNKTESQEKESGLIQVPTIIIDDISDNAARKIGESISKISNQDSNKITKNEVQNVDTGADPRGSSLVGTLLRGIIGVGGLTAVLGAFLSNDHWKGTLKLVGRATLSLTNLETGMKTFFTSFGRSIDTITNFFTKSAPFQFISQKLGVGKLFDLIRDSKLFSIFKGGRAKLLKIPGLGSIISFSMAYSRFEKGDTVGGIMEIASGIASLFPGVGTALSIGIDVLTALKDFSTGGTKGAEHMSFKDQAKAMLENIPNFISENVKKFVNWMGGLIEEFGMPAFEWAKEKSKELPKWIGKKVGEALIWTINTIKSGLSYLGNLKDNVSKYIEERGGWGEVASSIANSVGSYFTNTVFPSIKNFFSAETLGPINDKLSNFLKSTVRDFLSGFEEGLGLKGLLSSTYEMLKERYHSIISKFKSSIGDGLDKLVRKVTFGKFGIDTEKTDKVVSKIGERITGGVFNEDKASPKKVEAQTPEPNKLVKESSTQSTKQNDDLKKSIEELKETMVEALLENTNVSAAGSSLVAEATLASGGGGGSNVSVVNNNITTMSDISNFRRLARERIR